MHHSIRPLLFSNLFLCRPLLHPLMLMVMREGIVVAHLTRLVHEHMATTNLLQTVSVGQGTMATTNSTALHADLGNFGQTELLITSILTNLYS